MDISKAKQLSILVKKIENTENIISHIVGVMAGSMDKHIKASSRGMGCTYETTAFINDREIFTGMMEKAKELYEAKLSDLKQQLKDL